MEVPVPQVHQGEVQVLLDLLELLVDMLVVQFYQLLDILLVAIVLLEYLQILISRLQQ